MLPSCMRKECLTVTFLSTFLTKSSLLLRLLSFSSLRWKTPGGLSVRSIRGRVGITGFPQWALTLAIFRNGDVSAVATCARSKFRDRFIERCLVAAGNGDLRALHDEKSSCGQTDAAVAAGNKS